MRQREPDAHAAEDMGYGARATEGELTGASSRSVPDSTTAPSPVAHEHVDEPREVERRDERDREPAAPVDRAHAVPTPMNPPSPSASSTR